MDVCGFNIPDAHNKISSLPFATTFMRSLNGKNSVGEQRGEDVKWDGRINGYFQQNLIITFVFNKI